MPSRKSREKRAARSERRMQEYIELKNQLEVDGATQSLGGGIPAPVLPGLIVDAVGGEAELGEVPGERGPVLAVVSHQDHLEEAGQPAAEVQQDVAHTPALGALVAGDQSQGEAEADQDNDETETEVNLVRPGDTLIIRLHYRLREAARKAWTLKTTSLRRRRRRRRCVSVVGSWIGPRPDHRAVLLMSSMPHV